MEQLAQLSDMLDSILQPVFCVKSGIICHSNPAAKELHLQKGAPIAPFLFSSAEDYANFTKGRLYLTLCISNRRFRAAVFPVKSWRIFLIEPETAELHTMSLAARALREPLTGALNAVERLCKNTPGANLPEIGKVNRRLFQIMRMLNNMSDAPSCRSLQRPPMALYNIASLFNEFLSGIPELVSKSGRQFHFTGLSLDVFSLVNRELLERGIYNLISNAIQYSPENSAITAALDKKDNRLYFTVKNPISCDLAKATFCNFTQVSSQSKGIGLGMSIVRAACSIHGGAVLILRPKPHMVQITMTLPIRPNETPAGEQSPLQVDYTGNWEHSLVELSDCLPSSAFEAIW